jgi:predicted secreted Zn-dependent protease
MRFLAVSALLWSVVPHLGVPTPSRDECDLSVERREYLVRGSSSEEVRWSMLENGPRDARGHPRFAFTEWTVAWRWDRRADGNVDSDTVDLSCRATILLPRYDAGPGGTSGVSSLWTDFAKRLERHEYNHLEHVRRVAPEIRERIRRAERRGGGVSPAQANRIAGRVIREIRLLDETYDRETDHGKTEGTWSLS